MKYCGKSLDGFEYAFSSLLDANGVDTEGLPSLDCLSFRSFAFSGGAAVEEWFRPAAEWRFYLPVLMENLGCADALDVRPVRDAAPDAFRMWTLVGEAPYPNQRITPQSKFYRGTPSFFLCRRRPGRNGVLLCNPLGTPCDLVDEEALCASLERSDGFLASFRRPPVVRVPPARTVLDLALAWRRTCGSHIAVAGFPYAQLYHGGVREEISLRYGLMNYHVQTDKTIRFFSDAGLLAPSIVEQLAQMLLEIPGIWKNGRFELLHQLDQALWTALEKAG